MPGGILIGIVSWLASHLIVFSLLGFVVLGLFVFGVVPLDPRDTGTVVLDTPDGSAAARDVRPYAANVADEPASETLAAPAPRPSKRPKMIGGSLPVYDRLPKPGQERPKVDSNGFRPSDGLAESPPLMPSYGEIIQRARRAFWNGDFEAAEAAYMDAVSAYPDDADAFGELGNLYESMGKSALAGDAFFAAGVRLKARGNHEKLSQIIDLLGEKGDERAQSLRAE